MSRPPESTGSESEGLRVVVVGNRDFSRQVLAAVAEEHEIVGIVGPDTEPQAGPPGYTSFHETAARHGAPVLATGGLGDPETIDSLERVRPDVCLCAGWTEIIPTETLAVPSNVFLGLHASTLPKNRGGAPVNWAIIRGEDEVGLSLFEFVEEVDDGDVYAQTSVPIAKRDDVGTVYDRLTLAARELARDSLAEIAADEAMPTPQDWSAATYLPQRKPEDGIIDWTRSASALVDWIRALTDPYPGAFTFHDGHRLTVWSAEEVERRAESAPGTIISVDDGAGVAVATGDGELCLYRAQFDDGPVAWADNRAESWGLRPGERLGQPDDYPEWTYTGIRDADGGFDYKTNLTVGDTAEIQAVVCSHSVEVSVDVTATVGGTTLVDRTITVDSRENVPVRVEPSDEGVHTLRISFDAPERSDTRYLNVYASASGGDP